MLEVAAQQVSLEQIMEVVGILKDTLGQAGADIEEAYELRQRPSMAYDATQCSAAVTCLVPANRRPFQTPAS